MQVSSEVNAVLPAGSPDLSRWCRYIRHGRSILIDASSLSVLLLYSLIGLSFCKYLVVLYD